MIKKGAAFWLPSTNALFIWAVQFRWDLLFLFHFAGDGCWCRQRRDDQSTNQLLKGKNASVVGLRLSLAGKSVNICRLPRRRHRLLHFSSSKRQRKTEGLFGSQPQFAKLNFGSHKLFDLCLVFATLY
jgi:hypothetical protein